MRNTLHLTTFSLLLPRWFQTRGVDGASRGMAASSEACSGSMSPVAERGSSAAVVRAAAASLPAQGHNPLGRNHPVVWLQQAWSKVSLSHARKIAVSVARCALSWFGGGKPGLGVRCKIREKLFSWGEGGGLSPPRLHWMTTTNKSQDCTKFLTRYAVSLRYNGLEAEKKRQKIPLPIENFLCNAHCYSWICAVFPIFVSFLNMACRIRPVDWSSLNSLARGLPPFFCTDRLKPIPFLHDLKSPLEALFNHTNCAKEWPLTKVAARTNCQFAKP